MRCGGMAHTIKWMAKMMKTKRVKLENLVPDNLNANRGTARGAGMVEHSIRNYGAGRSILVDAQNRIIAGNKTHAASLEAGLQDAVVVETDGTQLVVVRRSDVSLDSPEGRALAIADNRAAEVGLDWDLDALAEISEDLDLSQFWFDKEIDIPDLSLDGPGAEDGLTDPDEVPEVEGEPTTKRGDVWILGEHRVKCGDSTSADDVARLMGGELADMVFADIPYNISREHGGLREIDFGEWDKESEGVGLRAVKVVPRSSLAVVYVFGAARQLSENLLYLDSEGMTIRPFAWLKPAPSPMNGQHLWLSSFELCAYGRPSGAVHNAHCQKNIWEGVSPSGESRVHPTQKPVELVAFLIEASSARKAVVYDPFLGSGTSIIAAEQTGRRCYGLELSERYCDVIVKRWEEFTGRKAELESADK